MNSYPRREFVLRALAACGASFLGSEALVDVAHAQPGGKAGQGARAAAGYFGTKEESATKVGTLYLHQLNADTTPASILKATAPTMAIIGGAATPEKAVEALVAAVTRDFHEGKVVQVDNWILSRTEADLCALSLLPPA